MSRLEIDTLGTPCYHLANTLGSVRGVYDLSGTQAASTEYDVFGDVRASTGAPSLFAYTGEQHDPMTGFTHLRARDYDPATGQFTARDTVQPNADGTQGFNRYAYVANNPCSLTDPSGHAPSPLSCYSAAVGALLTLLRALVQFVTAPSKTTLFFYGLALAALIWAIAVCLYIIIAMGPGGSDASGPSPNGPSPLGGGSGPAPPTPPIPPSPSPA